MGPQVVPATKLEVSFSITSESALSLYKSSLEAGNRSPKTISWYMGILRRFFAFVENQSPDRPLGQLGVKEVEVYLLRLQNAARWASHPRMKANGGLSPYSIQGHARAVKAFFGWLFDQGYIEKNALAKFPLPKVPKNLVPILNVQQLKLLFGGLDKSTPIGARDYCVLAILLDTGLQISELVNIKMTDFDPMMTCLKVRGKCQKERLVPISKACRKEVARYMRYQRPLLCKGPSDYIFPARDGYHISVNSVQQVLRRLARKVGLGSIRVYPHLFRHTFGSMYLGKGGQSLMLKAIMGHESIQTTDKYVHLKPEDLQAQHVRFSPLADLLEK